MERLQSWQLVDKKTQYNKSGENIEYATVLGIWWDRHYGMIWI